MPNPFVHIELATDDVAGAKAFYSNLFGWKLTDTPMDYTLLDTGTPPGGGIFKRPPEAPAGWSVYVGVPDAAATLEKAKGLGAMVLTERTLISPEFGHFAVFRDPTGCVICLHEAGPMPKKKARPAKKAARKARGARRKGRR
ncbi:MAG TPA: VOC family protein [Anaeromyxobacteraceae bacterium]|nr:VOC family protein [Anaeromyxobacteraceae bacterium]